VKRLDILEQPDDVRALIGECELSGKPDRFRARGTSGCHADLV
jgi:hypothetical protein